MLLWVVDMNPRLKRVLATVSLAGLVLLMAGPASADPMGSIFSFDGLERAVNVAITVLIIVELLVIVFEAVFMMLVLKLPAATAFLWSVVANLLSATLGSILQGSIVLLLSLALASTGHHALLFPVLSFTAAILLAVAIEFTVLIALDRRGMARPRLLLCCAAMNVISLPLAYLLGGQLFEVMASA